MSTPAFLGTPDRTINARAAACAAARKKALAAYADVSPIAVKLRQEGNSLRKIASILNNQGRLTRNGSSFFPATVGRIIDRAASLPSPAPV